MNPAVLFLVGGVALAVVLSAAIWLFSRPRKVVDDPNLLRENLRAMRREIPGGGPRLQGQEGIRVLGHEEPDRLD